MRKKDKVIIIITSILLALEVIVFIFLGSFLVDKIELNNTIVTNDNQVSIGISKAFILVFTIIFSAAGVVISIVSFLINFIKIMKKKFVTKINYLFAYTSLIIFVLILVFDLLIIKI